MEYETTETEGTLSLAGELLEQFRAVRRRLAEAYGIDESVALEVALWGNLDEGYEADEDYETDEEWTERDIRKNPQKEVDAAHRKHMSCQGNDVHGWKIKSPSKEAIFHTRSAMGQTSDFEQRELDKIRKERDSDASWDADKKQAHYDKLDSHNVDALFRADRIHKAHVAKQDARVRQNKELKDKLATGDLKARRGLELVRALGGTRAGAVFSNLSKKGTRTDDLDSDDVVTMTAGSAVKGPSAKDLADREARAAAAIKASRAADKERRRALTHAAQDKRDQSVSQQTKDAVAAKERANAERNKELTAAAKRARAEFAASRQTQQP